MTTMFLKCGQSAGTGPSDVLTHMPAVVAFVALLVGAGGARLVYEVTSDALVQLSANPGMRGRIVSLYVSVFVGGQALCGLILGVLSDLLGPRMALILSGGIPLVATIVIGLIVARPSSLTVVLRPSKGFSMLSVVVREPE